IRRALLSWQDPVGTGQSRNRARREPCHARDDGHGRHPNRQEDHTRLPAQAGEGSSFDRILREMSRAMSARHERIASSHRLGPPEHRSIASRRRRSVLVVEDDRAMQLFLEQQLRGLGYEVNTAADGETACYVLERSPETVDVILLDRTLPGIDG